MDTRKVMGLALIVPPVIAIVGWFFMGFVVFGGVGPDKPGEFIAELRANSEIVKYVMPLITILFLMAIWGINYIKNSMEGGPGHLLAGFGFFLVVLGSAAQLGEVAFTIATAEGPGSMAGAMHTSSQAMGTVATAITMVGAALIGIGILQQKNFNPLVGGLLTVAGIYCTVMALAAYDSPLMGIGFIAIVVSFVCLGVSLLRNEE
ncbi:MAG TPA: hypothetical protein DEP04_03290 [Dehalococcoidia bacterium]|nr:hypothetical protein [Dehalococcoidia bacterium]